MKSGQNHGIEAELPTALWQSLALPLYAAMLLGCAGAPPQVAYPPPPKTVTAAKQPEPRPAAAAPALEPGQLSDARVVVGLGDCRTLRRAVHQRDGYIELELDRPYSKRCGFGQLALVIDGIALAGPIAIGPGIALDTRSGSYYWTESRGRIRFAYDKPLSAELVAARNPSRFGLVAIGCARESCLSDEAFANADGRQLIKEGQVRSSLEQGRFTDTFNLYQQLQDPRLLPPLLTAVAQDERVYRALAVHAVRQEPSALAAAAEIARNHPTVANLMPVYAFNKDRELLRLAYSAASTLEDKRAVELAVLQSIQDKLFDFKVTMAGTGKTSSSDSDLLIARVVNSTVKSSLSYSGQLKTDVFAPSFDYAVDTVVTLTVQGNINGERNCGLLWANKCEIKNEAASRVHEYPIAMVFRRAQRYQVSGQTEIDWKSMSGGSGMASGLLMGGTLLFKANGAFDIKVKVKSVRLLS